MSEAVATDRPVAAAMSRLTTGAEAMRCRITAKRLVRRMSWYVRFNDAVLCWMELGSLIVSTGCTPLELPGTDFF
ncbi:SJCHGC07561 protein [Streptomyces azureus]|uniref:SJCHGC07561 protein n=1 Tax=Streptomyces azureus TaxID=146537 RepID=A0A0K8PLT0_STRAJ|nr:SJCHGC07561 protein [Streptomyces azureus]